MQEELSTVIVAAYTPEEYEKVFRMAEDRDGTDKNWEEWRQATDEKEAEAARTGVEYVEQYIDAEGLLKYCLATGRLANVQTRVAYANYLYGKQRRESMALVDKSEAGVSIAPPDTSEVEASIASSDQSEVGASIAPLDQSEVGASIASPDTSEVEEHTKTPPYSYTPPVDQLLTYTRINSEDPFPKISYAEKFGLGPEDIPELIRMVTDNYLGSEEASEFEFAAPLHALNTLTELHAEAAIDPLLTIYDKASENENEWMLETLVDFYTAIGPVAFPSLEQFLADPLHDSSTQGYVTEIIDNIADKYPEAHTECIAILSRRLADFEINKPELNGALVRTLLQMKAVEAAPVIEAAYASGRVDDFWGGDWDEAQYELGLKERPATPERASFSLPSTPTRSTTSVADTYTHTSKKKAPASKKAKVKMAKASKKANRRKK